MIDGVRTSQRVETLTACGASGQLRSALQCVPPIVCAIIDRPVISGTRSHLGEDRCEQRPVSQSEADFDWHHADACHSPPREHRLGPPKA
jgi:hypothetical protein